MKTASFLWMLVAASAVSPALAFDVPRTVHPASDLDKAIAEATKSKRGLVFVASDSSLKPS